ncbi:MAG: fatty acid CoA ligase family protein [Vulcanimicrobiota bacterium]
MTFNVAEFLDDTAARYPAHTALIDGAERWNFEQLLGLCNTQAEDLQRLGFVAGDRVLMLVNNSAQFVSLTFALFKLGAQPILIDPGMGLKPMLRSIGSIRPDGLVAIPKGHLVSRLFRQPFQAVKKRAVLGRFPGVPEVARRARATSFSTLATDPDQTAALLFTSGSTGPAKAVVYRHRIFQAQVEALQRMYDFEPGEVDLPGFPLFALFSTAMGVTCVIPPLNPSRPATVDPARMVTAIHAHGVTSLQGSPAIWSRVGEYCRSRKMPLPTVRRVLTFGAPIATELLRTWKAILPAGAEVHTPYGATEALPVTSISGSQALAAAPSRLAGAGTCVGPAAPNIEIRILPISDQAFDSLPDALPPGEVGEVCVRGPVVTWAYQDQPEATRLAKIESEDGLWHRMGDLGYLDPEHNLWLVGRKAHRVEWQGQTFFPVAAEGMVNGHPEVARSALVAGKSGPTLVVERRPGSRSSDTLLAHECRGLLARHPLYGQVKEVTFHPRFPVDPRHNAKIHREELSAWAGGRRS